MAKCLVGIGANLGDPSRQLVLASDRLARHDHVRLEAVSRTWRSPPVGGPSGQPPYLNAVASVETDLTPQQLLAELQGIERELGRRPAARWDARAMDLDILLYGSHVICQPDLLIPHPWMVARSFVLGPAADVAPDLEHPVLGWTMRQLWQHQRAVPPRFVLLARTDAVNMRSVVAQTCADRIEDVERHVTSAIVPSAPEQLELLTSRAIRLQQSGWNETHGRVKLSEFWIDESLLQARATLGDEELQAFERRFREVDRVIAPPKLVILARGAMDAAGADRDVTELWSKRLREHIIRRRVAPYVEVATSVAADFVREVVGVIIGMQTVSRVIDS